MLWIAKSMQAQETTARTKWRVALNETPFSISDIFVWDKKLGQVYLTKLLFFYSLVFVSVRTIKRHHHHHLAPPQRKKGVV